MRKWGRREGDQSLETGVAEENREAEVGGELILETRKLQKMYYVSQLSIPVVK